LTKVTTYILLIMLNGTSM